MAPTLEGRIVRLEPLTREHANGLWEASRDPRTWRWLSILQPRDAGGAASLDRRGSRGVRRALRDRAPRDGPGGRQHALPCAPPGANVEAKLLMLEHAFGTMGCRHVELKTDALNERSCRAIAALGASFEGVHRKHMLVRDGENRDSAWYSILDDEWPEVRERLLRRLGRV